MFIRILYLNLPKAIYQFLFVFFFSYLIPLQSYLYLFLKVKEIKISIMQWSLQYLTIIPERTVVETTNFLGHLSDAMCQMEEFGGGN